MNNIHPSSRGVIGFSHENNDCTVRAVANATGHDYEMCHATLHHYGRPNKQGAVIRTIAKAYSELGLFLFGVFGTSKTALDEHETLTKLLGEESVNHYHGMTFKRFMSMNPKGSYVCINRNHAFAVVNGKLIDRAPVKEGTYITCVFKFAAV